MNEAAPEPTNPAEPPAGQPTQTTRFISWSLLAKAFAATVATMAAAFNFIGQEAYAEYLRRWGFDEGMLPLDTSNRVHYGYLALLESLHSLLTWNGAVPLVIGIFCCCFVAFLSLSGVKDSPPDNRFVGWLKRRAGQLPEPVRNLLAAFSLSGVIVVVLCNGIFAAFAGLIVAPLIGEHAANRWVAEKERDIEKGCLRTGDHSVCTEFRRGGQVIGTGVIITSSTTRIAYFDIVANHPRLIKFEDGELTGWMPMRVKATQAGI